MIISDNPAYGKFRIGNFPQTLGPFLLCVSLAVSIFAAHRAHAQCIETPILNTSEIARLLSKQALEPRPVLNSPPTQTHPETELGPIFSARTDAAKPQVKGEPTPQTANATGAIPIQNASGQPGPVQYEGESAIMMLPFAQYPVRISQPLSSSPILDGKRKQSFRTRLRKAMTEPPNFAGHYSLVSWGCGQGCADGMVVDRNTGEVVDIPADVSLYGMEWNDAWQYRPDSRLIVIAGGNNAGSPWDQNADLPRRYYIFNDGTFRLIKSESIPHDPSWDSPSPDVSAALSEPATLVSNHPRPDPRPSETVARVAPKPVETVYTRPASTPAPMVQQSSPSVPERPATVSMADLDRYMTERYAECWSWFSGKGHYDYVSEFMVHLNPQGQLAEPPLLLNTPTSTIEREIAESARRAVASCILEIPTSYAPYYERWKYRRLRFDSTATHDQSAATPVDQRASLGLPSRAAFVVQNSAGTQQTTTLVGEVRWSAKIISGVIEDIEADVVSKDAGASVRIKMSPNLDRSLPAAVMGDLQVMRDHATFLTSVNKISMPQMRQTNVGRGDALEGTTAPITNDHFMFAISKSGSGSYKVQTNGWFDIPLAFTDGRIGKVTFEKPTLGTQLWDQSVMRWLVGSR